MRARDEVAQVSTMCGALLRCRRIDQRKSQEAVAIDLNVSNSVLSRYESGHARLTLDGLVEVLGLLDVSPTRFFAAFDLLKKRLCERGVEVLSQFPPRRSRPTVRVLHVDVLEPLARDAWAAAA